MDEKFIIAPELIIYYPDVSKPGMKKILAESNNQLLVSCCTTLDTSAKKSRLKERILYLYNRNTGRNVSLSRDDIKELKIKNTNLNIKLVEDNRYFRNFDYNYYGSSILIELQSSELNGYEFRPIMYFSLDNILEIVTKAPVIKYGQVSYDLCLASFSDSVSEHKMKAFIEDENNEALTLAKEAGSGLRKKKTSFWTPGHMYILNNKKYIIALGDIQNFIYMPDYWNYGSTIHPFRMRLFDKDSNYQRRYLNYISNARMFLEIGGDIDDYKGKSIYDILIDIVENNDDSKFVVRDCNATKLTGTDLGKVLEPCDNYLVKLKLYCKEKLEEKKDERYLRFYPEYFGNRKQELQDHLTELYTKYFDYCSNDRYYGISSFVFTEEDFKASSTYVNILIDLNKDDSLYHQHFTRDELDKILTSCIPAKFS